MANIEPNSKLNIALVCFLSLSIDSKEIKVKTWFGDPNLQGIWTNASLTTLERPNHLRSWEVTEEVAIEESLKAQKVSEAYDNPLEIGEEIKASRDPGGYNAAWMDGGSKFFKVKDKYRTSVIGYPKNGKLPWDAEKSRKFFQKLRPRGMKRTDHPELRGVGERCIVGFGSSGGPPMMNVLYNNHYQIVQSPGYVMIMAEMIHDTRIIRLNSEHLPKSMKPWLGDSVGFWEGNTLVVETTNFHPQHQFRAGLRHRFAITENAKITEKFTRISQNEIIYQFFVDDKDVYKDIWAGEMVLSADNDKIYEYACHEGNYSMENILAGARTQD